MSTTISRQIEQLGPWFHNLHLPDGSKTAPNHELGDFPRYKWLQILPYVPEHLDGWTVLDIGCNAGFYSFALADKGAKVTAIDCNEHYLKQARWAAGFFTPRGTIEFRRATIYQLAQERREYDLVLFMGVFYHLRYPLLALDLVRSCCRKRFIFQTMTVPDDTVYQVKDDYLLEERVLMNQSGFPKMAFIEHNIAGDPTNWWLPNHAGVEAMLRSAGFSDIQRIGHEIYCSICDVPPNDMVVEELHSVFDQISR